MTESIAQKWLSRRMVYTFDEENLRVEFEDASEAWTFHVPYIEIPFESRRYTEKMEALRGASIVMLVLAGITLLSALSSPMSAATTIVTQLVIAGAAYLAYGRFRATFTLIDTERGRITVLDDESHDQVLGEIENRRRDLLRKHFAAVDHDNDPNQEGRKLEWLRRNGVISDSEFQDRIAELGGEVLALPDDSKTVH